MLHGHVHDFDQQEETVSEQMLQKLQRAFYVVRSNPGFQQPNRLNSGVRCGKCSPQAAEQNTCKQ